MVTLAESIGATDSEIRVEGDVSGVTRGLRFRLGNELLDLSGFGLYPLVNGYRRSGQDPTLWRVNRGVGDSIAAAHDAGTTVRAARSASVSSSDLTPPAPFPTGEGGSVSVTDGETTIEDVSTISLQGASVSADGPGVAQVAIEGTGEQRIRLLGPFHIAHDTTDIQTDGVAVAELPACFVLGIYLEITETFDGITDGQMDFEVGVGPGLPAVASWQPCLVVTEAGYMQTTVSAAGTTRLQYAPPDGTGSTSFFRHIRLDEPGHLICVFYPDGVSTEGEADIYVLISEPAD